MLPSGFIGVPVDGSDLATMTSSNPPIAMTRIEPREPPVAEVTRTLLDFLLSGQIAPGSKIPSERQLAQALDIGRSAVREAIKSLSVLGLLQVRQGDGTYLARSGSSLLPQVIEWGLLLGEPRVLDLIEARRHIEVTIAGLAAERATDEGVAQLRRQLEAMRAAGDDVAAYVEADVAFHLQIATLSNNEIFASLVTSLRSLLGAWAHRVLEHAGETSTSLPMHEPIVAAIAAHDADAARAAMTAHMERAERRLREALSAHGESAGDDASA
jgi:GntR family transcriptional regulator, transcriptional repressor for pyruvate dehydrogenase complex